MVSDLGRIGHNQAVAITVVSDVGGIGEEQETRLRTHSLIPPMNLF